MTPTISLLVSFVAVAIAFGFAYLWYATSPRKGSGWALFAAGLIALAMTPPVDPIVGVVTYAALAIGFSGGWYWARPLKYSGWLLAIGILAGLQIVEYRGTYSIQQ